MFFSNSVSSFKLVDAFPLEMHWFLYCEKRFFSLFGVFLLPTYAEKNALSSDVVKQCNGVEPWHHGEEKQIYAGEIFVFWLPEGAGIQIFFSRGTISAVHTLSHLY